MKTLLLALLFCQAVVKIYSLSRFEDLTAVKLTELKREWKEVEESNSKLTAKLVQLLDEGGSGEDTGSGEDKGSGEGKGSGEDKGSGVEPSPGPEKELKALRKIVDALRKNIIPAVVKASKRRDEESKEYAGELVEMLKGKADKMELTQALGKTVVEVYKKCDKIQAGFLKLANESGVLIHFKEKPGSDKEENEVETIKELLGSDEENEDFEALEKMGSGGKSNNPALKSFIIIYKMLSKATCGNPAKALVDLVDKRISEEDPRDPFPDLKDRIMSFLGLDDKRPKACKRRQGLIDKNDKIPDSPKEKMLRLFLEAPKKILCKDVPVAKRYLGITMEAIELGKKIRALKTVDATLQFALIRKIKIYLAQGRYDDVAELVGEAVLDGLKKGLLISLTVKNTKGVPKPKPALPPPFKPKGPTAQKEPFDLDSIISASRM